MNPIQQAISKRNKRIVIGVGIIFAGLWVLLVLYVLSSSKTDYHGVQPGIVEVHPSAPGMSANPVAIYRPAHPGGIVSRPIVTPQTMMHSVEAPRAHMGSTSAGIYLTSSVSMQSIGGGSGGSGGSSGGGRGRGSRGSGVGYAALAYSGAIYIPIPNNAVTEVGAKEADDVSSHKMSVIKRQKHDEGLPGYNPDPMPDEEETPVGDVAWGLMALLAGAYGYHLFRRNKPQSKQASM